jgi:hypothetical protein
MPDRVLDPAAGQPDVVQRGIVEGQEIVQVPTHPEPL